MYIAHFSTVMLMWIWNCEFEIVNECFYWIEFEYETERGMLEVLEELIDSGVTSGDLGLQQNMWVSRMAAPYPHGSK